MISSKICFKMHYLKKLYKFAKLWGLRPLISIGLRHLFTQTPAILPTPTTATKHSNFVDHIKINSHQQSFGRF